MMSIHAFQSQQKQIDLWDVDILSTFHETVGDFMVLPLSRPGTKDYMYSSNLWNFEIIRHLW